MNSNQNRPKRIVLIGFGAMAELVMAHLPSHIAIAGIIITERSYHRVIDSLQNHYDQSVEVATSIDQLTIKSPDLVLEVAGHEAINTHAEDVLLRGWDLALISVGALADEKLYQRLNNATNKRGSRLTLLSGAIGGMDALSAAKQGGLDRVLYQGIKAIEGWRNSYAEELIDLDNIEESTLFFRGTAREAAQLFPENSNVAATIGLLGVGLDQTYVELIADPYSEINCHRIEVEGTFGQFTFDIAGRPLDTNPGTSQLAAYSVIDACERLL